MPKDQPALDSAKAIAALNQILELELAGVVRCLHYSLMKFGHARIPIIAWMTQQASEGMTHATQAGEHVTPLGGYPSLKIGKLIETHKHDIDQIFREAPEHKRETLQAYYSLLSLVEGRSVRHEEYTLGQISLKEGHTAEAEVEKMIRRPGELQPAR